MRIGDGPQPPNSALPAKPDTPATEGERSEPQQAAISDVASLSPIAVQTSNPGPDRIEALRLAVQRGTYRVSSEELATRLIESHLKQSR